MQGSMGRVDVTFDTWYHLYIALDTKILYYSTIHKNQSCL